MIILLIKLFLVSWFWNTFEPIHKFLYLLNKKRSKKKIINNINDNVYKVLSCLYCFSFWFVLIITFNIWYALIVSFVAYIYKKIEASL